MSAVYRLTNTATLTNAVSYPVVAAGSQHPRIRDLINATPDEHDGTVYLQVAAATFGTATLQPRWSLDAANWVTIGSALTAVGITSLGILPLSAYVSFLVGGTGDITVASLYIA